MPALTRLIVEPLARAPGRFRGWLEESGEEIVRSASNPLVEASQRLLQRGFDPAGLITMRMANRSYDSFCPASVEVWAKYREAD